MSDPSAGLQLDARPEAPLRESAARRALVRRIMDVVALPASRAGVQDRAIAGDLLLEMLLDSDVSTRELCARRMREMSQAPKRLLRFLALDVPKVAEIILAENKAFDEADFVHIVEHGQAFHRRMVASRREAGSVVATVIAGTGDLDAIRQLLLNQHSRLSERAVDLIVNASRADPSLPPLLIDREELRPAHALAMFWWCRAPERAKILMRFSAERTVLIDACADIFRQVRAEQAHDPILQKALRVIERRQRDRDAIARSPFGSLEEAVAEAKATGLDAQWIADLSEMGGVRPETGAKIFSDEGGEGVAVFCKATGLKRAAFADLWVAARGAGPEAAQAWERVRIVYESIAVAKAQTVLRYWNWTLSAAFAPEPATDEAARAR